MVLESLFQSYQFVPAWVQFLGLISGAAVALGAGLIVIAMVKFLGFTLLWSPASSAAPRRSRGLALPIGAVGAVVLGLGVGAPWVLRFLAPTVSAFVGSPAAAPVGQLLAVPTGWSILSGSPFGILSPPMIPITIGLGALVGLGYYLLGRPSSRPARRAAVWMAGSPAGQPGELYTSFGYSTGLRIMMATILGTREIRSSAGSVSEAGLATPVPYSVDLEVLDIFKLFYDDLVRAGEGLAALLKHWIMPGRLGRYLAYILIVVVAVVIYVAAAAG